MDSETLKTAMDILTALGGLAVVAITAYTAYHSQKMRADFSEFKNELREWTYENFISRDEHKLTEFRLDRLEERPSSRELRPN